MAQVELCELEVYFGVVEVVGNKVGLRAIDFTIVKNERLQASEVAPPRMDQVDQAHD